ncbi:hypothetical protein BGZ99_000672 [Dissophora globulifera]|uniref:Lipase n=1 Tax=Dissophora globulifera TaxID=979702 RepID=A0A9P6R4F7_9FUNG|nr:hypothetical protein BGZ99_000672 [Dissophora globulifera]
MRTCNLVGAVATARVLLLALVLSSSQLHPLTVAAPTLPLAAADSAALASLAPELSRVSAPVSVSVAAARRLQSRQDTAEAIKVEQAEGGDGGGGGGGDSPAALTRFDRNYLAMTPTPGLGYCVFQLKYGQVPGMPQFGGLSDIRESAQELATFVEKVQRLTGAESVDLIAHSEGTVVSRWYLKFLNGGNAVDAFVSVSPVGRGTSLMGLVGVTRMLGWLNNYTDIIRQFCIACVQLIEGSDLLQALYEDGQETVPGVRYLNLVTKHDGMVTPFTSGIMHLPASASYWKKETQNVFSQWIHHLLGGNQDNTDVAVAATEENSDTMESKNLIIEDHCPNDSSHANHFKLFQSAFVLSAADAFFSHHPNLEAAIQCS